jgi:hypothetical protein
VRLCLSDRRVTRLLSLRIAAQRQIAESYLIGISTLI